MKKSVRIGFIFTVILVVICMVVAAYKIPTKMHAVYLQKDTLYENDPISERNFNVYTTTWLGQKKKITDYKLNTHFANSDGTVTITSGKLHLSAKVQLPVTRVASSSLRYNSKCYEDRIGDYQPDVSEFIIYKDGTMKTNFLNLMDVDYEINSDDHTVSVGAVGSFGIYEKEFAMITVDSITTKDTGSTKESLSAKNLELTVHYSDGTSVTMPQGKITSDVIKKPKAGINKLTCYYDLKRYTVKVECYKPKPTVTVPSVTFEGYGTYILQYSKPYEVNTAKLDTYVGVRYFNNHRETYYSQNVLGGTALDIPGRHVAEDGTVRDIDGYICAAADFSFCQKYQVVLSTLGPAKIYDTGCPYGTVDLYVNW